jgi:hypothetical protein
VPISRQYDGPGLDRARQQTEAPAAPSAGTRPASRWADGVAEADEEDEADGGYWKRRSPPQPGLPALSLVARGRCGWKRQRRRGGGLQLGSYLYSGGNEWLLSWELISVAYCWGFNNNIGDGGDAASWALSQEGGGGGGSAPSSTVRPTPTPTRQTHGGFSARSRKLGAGGTAGERKVPNLMCSQPLFSPVRSAFLVGASTAEDLSTDRLKFSGR